MEPIKIGWLGSALDGPGGGYDKIHRLAFDEAAEQGLLDRPVEFVLHPENGLPHGSAKNATDGFRYLVDEGCIGVAGAYSSDNAITVGPLANELQVPLISWCGTERLQGEYCFRLGNGDCGGDAALVVGVAEAQRPRARRGAERDLAERRGVLPVLPPGVPAPRRQHRRGRDREPEPRRTSPTNLDNLRQVEPDALVYMGYGMLAAKGLLREALDKLGWDPPRIMGTAFMFYLMGFDKFEGWVGIDQFDPSNPLVEGVPRAASSRATARTRRCGRTRSRCSRTTPRACWSKALFRAPILSGPGLKAGLETIRFMPSTTGGPQTHIACSPVRARDVPRRLAALRPGRERQARVRRPVRALGVSAPRSEEEAAHLRDREVAQGEQSRAVPRTPPGSRSRPWPRWRRRRPRCGRRRRGRRGC